MMPVPPRSEAEEEQRRLQREAAERNKARKDQEREERERRHLKGSNAPRALCVMLSFLTMLVGGAGVTITFLHLGTQGRASEAAVAVAWAVLFGSGLVSLTLLVTRERHAR